MDAAFGQLVDLDAKGLYRLGRDLAADLHAVVPAREKEIGLGAGQNLFRRILRRQFRQFGDALAHFGIQRLPARDSGIAHHAVAQAQHQHHLGQVHIV